MENLKEKLENAIEKLINSGVVNFESGGALGFDTMAASSVLKMKQTYPSVKLILVLPCENQGIKWKPSEIETYEYIKLQADECIYTSKEYYDGCMLKRIDIWLIMQSLLYLHGMVESSGEPMQQLTMQKN